MNNLRLVTYVPKMRRPIGTSVPYIATNKAAPLVFAREQSQASRGMEWEGRMQPLTPWCALILRGLGIAAMVGLVAWSWFNL